MGFSTNDLTARAIELWEADRTSQDEADERTFAKEALAELHVPPEYLDKARAELDIAARHDQRDRRTRRVRIAVAVAGCLACMFLLQTFHPYALGAWESSFAAPHAWRLHENPGTRAHLQHGAGPTPTAGSLWLQVEAFTRPQDGRFFANLRAQHPPRTLWGRDEMLLTVRGEGGLVATRVYLRAGANERWRSPRIPLTGEWVDHRIPIADFERQTGGRAAWEPAPWETPVGLSMLQLKVGYNINEFDAAGGLGLRRIRFE